MNKTDVVNALMSGLTNVKFTKINGDIRDMTCTLDEIIIGAPLVTESQSKVKAQAEDAPVVIRCYDINAEGWRSFRLDNVVTFHSSTLSWTK
tara:strand:- start:36750 stop:37025 length:276 start_codon:yes stop_codon:yes gene_type:complete